MPSELKECNTYQKASKQLLEMTKSNLPLMTFERQSFDNWRWQGRENESDPIPEQHHELWQALGDFNKPETPFLLLYGIRGVGKTHLCRAIGWQRIQGCLARVLMYQVDVILDKLRISYEKGGYADLLESLQECDLLILDDLGDEAVTDWGEAKLDAVVDYRYSYGRQTIITTNDLENIPERILDRCKEGRIVSVNGESQRGVNEK